jgi:hypothetical protein
MRCSNLSPDEIVKIANDDAARDVQGIVRHALKMSEKSK